MKLSITTAWNETSAFVKQEAGALFLIAFALGVLPGIILQVVFGRLIGPGLQVAPGAKPDLAPFLSALPLVLLLFIPVFVLSIWGNLTINILALRRERVIGSAFGAAARRTLPLIGATLLLVLAAFIMLLPMVAIAGIGSGAPRVGLFALLFFILWLAFVFIAVRLMLMTSVAAAEPLGPIGIVRRSWQLTSGHFWKLLGFLFLLMLVLLVFALVVGAVVGILLTLTLGQPTPGSFSSLVLQLITGALQAIFITYFIVLIARIYTQLSGDTASVAQVFQ